MFFFNVTATTEIYTYCHTLSLHDALPISNALIQRKGPRLGLLTTAGFRASVPLSRAKGYGTGLDHKRQMDVPNAQRPDPIVPIPMILEVRERVDFDGGIVMKLDEEDLRRKLRELVDKGAEATVVVLANSSSEERRVGKECVSECRYR